MYYYDETKKKKAILIFIVLLIHTSLVFSKDMNILEFGAKADGLTENQEAIQKAINTVFSTGGGRVIVPKGIFITGTIEIKSNVTLHLNEGAILKGSPNFSESKYPKISPGYNSFLARSDIYPEKVLIYAKDANRVGISGPGIIDGNGMSLKLPEGNWQKQRLSCVNLIRFISCKNVELMGESSDKPLLIRNSAHWAVQPMNCDSVHIQYVRIENYGGVTPDGLPISDSRNVLVEDCFISSDDDALGLKNGSPDIVVENIIVKRTVFESTNTGFKSGSPQSFGPFKNVKFIGCTFRTLDASLKHADHGEHHGFFIGILVGGGSYEDVLIEDCIIENTRMPFAMYIGKIRQGYWAQWWPGREVKDEFGTVKNIIIRNVSYKNPNSYGVLIEGRKGFEIENILMENVYLPSKGNKMAIPIPEEKIQSYPNMSSTYGELPAYGFFIRNAKKVRMKNVWSWPLNTDDRPCLLTDNVTDLDVSGLNEGFPPDNYVPAVSFDIIKEESPSSVYIKANSRDHDGYIKNVKLFVNEKLVSEKKDIPFEWYLNDLKKGAHVLKLVATDNDGQTSSVTSIFEK